MEMKSFAYFSDKYSDKKPMSDNFISNECFKINNLPTHKLAKGIVESLQRVAEQFGYDSAYLFEFDEEKTTILSSYIWNSNKVVFVEGTTFPIEVVEGDWWNQIRDRGYFQVGDVKSMSNKNTLKSIFSSYGLQSVNDIILFYESEMSGFIGLSSASKNKMVAKSEVPLFQIYGNFLLAAIKKKKTEEYINDWKSSFEHFIEQTTDALFCFQMERPMSTTLPLEEQVDAIYNAKLILANRVLAKSYGYESEDDIINKKFIDIIPEKSESLTNLFVNFVESSYKISNEISEEPVTGGEVRFFSNNAHGIVENDHLISIWGSFQDITESEVLRRRLDLASKFEVIGRVASGIAHDFNNQLSIISGHIHRIEEKNTDQTLGRSIEKIIHTCNKGARIVRQILNHGRKTNAAEVELFLNKGLSEIVDEVKESVIDHRLAITFNANKDYIVRFDPNHFHQILCNLIFNAKEAINGHGGLIDISLDEIKVAKKMYGFPDLIDPNDYIILCLKDNGSGMCEEVLPRIFDPFFTTKPKGSGLGLVGVLKLIKQNNSYLQVKSKKGTGSEFQIFIPKYKEIQCMKIS